MRPLPETQPKHVQALHPSQPLLAPPPTLCAISQILSIEANPSLAGSLPYQWSKLGLLQVGPRVLFCAGQGFRPLRAPHLLCSTTSHGLLVHNRASAQRSHPKETQNFARRACMACLHGVACVQELRLQGAPSLMGVLPAEWSGLVSLKVRVQGLGYPCNH